MIAIGKSIDAEAIRKVRDYARANGPGVAGSAFLHGLGLLLILFFLARTGTPPTQSATPFLPVDIVQLGDETTAPPATQKSIVPQQRAARIPIAQSQSPQTPRGVAPSKTTPPVDSVEAKLRGLAQLRQPETALLSLNNASDANIDTTSNGAVTGDEAAYGLRDYIRAQVERRWSLDFAMLGKRNFIIPIHLEMKRNGTVIAAEIVDKARYKKDAVYREIALSARNAVILSSPFALPEGRYRETLDMVLMLNPKDTLR